MNDLDFFFKKYPNLNEIQKEQLEMYKELIQEENKVMNLTGIDDDFGIYLKHFYDSLTIVNRITDEYNKIADLGTGAGFPGIVLAIYYPNKEFHLIEPLTKRCNFLQKVIEKINLKNVKIINKRAEDLPKEQYDLVVSRAVARLNILLELSIPLVKINGLFIALKGPQSKDEILESKNALIKLDSSIYKIDELSLPFEESTRNNIIIKKNNKTSTKYPRNFGQIKKKPL